MKESDRFSMNFRRYSCPPARVVGNFLQVGSLSARSKAKPLYCLLKDIYAGLELPNWDKFAGSMSDANIARTEDYGLGAKFRKLSCFSSKGDSA